MAESKNTHTHTHTHKENRKRKTKKTNNQKALFLGLSPHVHAMIENNASQSSSDSIIKPWPRRVFCWILFYQS